MAVCFEAINDVEFLPHSFKQLDGVDMDAIDKILFAEEHQVAEWLSSGYNNLTNGKDGIAMAEVEEGRSSKCCMQSTPSGPANPRTRCVIPASGDSSVLEQVRAL